jgi:ribose transport system permease protein
MTMTTAAVAPPPAKAGSTKRSSGGLHLLRRWGTIIVIVLVGLLFCRLSPYFPTVSNFNNILFSMIVSALVSMGLTFVVAAGSFDLSVGVVVTTVSIVTAMLIPHVGMGVAIAGGLLTGWSTGCL